MTVTPEGKKPWGAGRVAFFMHRDAIQRALDEGHSMAAIHRAHAKALGIGYDQFVNYVAQYLHRPMAGRTTAPKLGARAAASPSLSASPMLPPLPQPPIPKQQPGPQRAPAEERRRFRVDPMAMRDKNLI